MEDQEFGKKQRVESRRKKAKKNVIAATVGLFCLIFLMPALPYIGGLVGFYFQVSEGDRVGQIVKLSHKGLGWRTWEGTLGVTQSGAYVEAWDFSVDSQSPRETELVSQIRQAYSTGSLVKVHYTQRFLPLYWRGKTSYFAEEIEAVRSR